MDDNIDTLWQEYEELKQAEEGPVECTCSLDVECPLHSLYEIEES